MDTSEIMRELEAERDRLDLAIAALNGQPKRYKARRATARHRISAAARKRMSRAQKARWKKAKQQSKG